MQSVPQLLHQSEPGQSEGVAKHASPTKLGALNRLLARRLGLELPIERGLHSVFLVFAKDFWPLRNGAGRKPASLGCRRHTPAKGFDCLLFGHHGAMLAGLCLPVNALTLLAG